jgi:hypothetical protein
LDVAVRPVLSGARCSTAPLGAVWTAKVRLPEETRLPEELGRADERDIDGTALM